jgi:hypothetical protein
MEPITYTCSYCPATFSSFGAARVHRNDCHHDQAWADYIDNEKLAFAEVLAAEGMVGLR